MPVTRTETARKFLAKELEKLSEQEREVVARFINRGRVARSRRGRLDSERGRRRPVQSSVRRETR